MRVLRNFEVYKDQESLQRDIGTSATDWRGARDGWQPVEVMPSIPGDRRIDPPLTVVWEREVPD